MMRILECKDLSVREQKRVKRLKDHGYNPIHLFAHLYLVRNHSINYKKHCFYGLMIIKEKE